MKDNPARLTLDRFSIAKAAKPTRHFNRPVAAHLPRQTLIIFSPAIPSLKPKRSLPVCSGCPNSRLMSSSRPCHPLSSTPSVLECASSYRSASAICSRKTNSSYKSGTRLSSHLQPLFLSPHFCLSSFAIDTFLPLPYPLRHSPAYRQVARSISAYSLPSLEPRYVFTSSAVSLGWAFFTGIQEPTLDDFDCDFDCDNRCRCRK